MFAGHVGVGLALGSTERRVNVGVFVAASLLLDLLLWLFILVGLESVTIPVTFAKTHQAHFIFPLSHGLATSIIWSVVAGAVAYGALSGERAKRQRIALLLALAVFSHWILDAIVHRPEMPLLGLGSTTVGLSLWDHLWVSLPLEAVILISGLALFVSRSPINRARTAALAGLSVLILVFTLVGMTVAPPPPSATAMAASSLVTITMVSAMTYWFGKSRLPDSRRS